MAKKKPKPRKARPDEDVFRGKEVQWKKADGKAPYLETNIDRFYKLVEKRGSISFTEAAGEYGVDKDQIASWARILESHKLARVHYPVFGTPIIMHKEAQASPQGNIKGEKAQKPPSRAFPKMMMVGGAGAMILLGVVLFVNTPATIAFRSSLAAALQQLSQLLAFIPLKYPLNIVLPGAGIIAAAWAFAGMRRRKKPKSDSDMREKIGRIKKELE